MVLLNIHPNNFSILVIRRSNRYKIKCSFCVFYHLCLCVKLTKKMQLISYTDLVVQVLNNKLNQFYFLYSPTILTPESSTIYYQCEKMQLVLCYVLINKRSWGIDCIFLVERLLSLVPTCQWYILLMCRLSIS